MPPGVHNPPFPQMWGDPINDPTVTIPGMTKEFGVGDKLTEEEAKQIAAASGGMLKFENGVLTGHNPDGSGDVYIQVGEPLSMGQLHDLHHTVPGSGGRGNSNNEGGGGGGGHNHNH